MAGKDRSSANRKGLASPGRVFRDEELREVSSIKDINFMKVVSLIRSVGAISRSEIARTLKLSRTTVTTVAKNLLNEGVIVESGKAESKGGRKALLLRLNRAAKVCVGIEISDNECRGLLTDLYAEPLGEVVKVPIAAHSSEALPGERALQVTFEKLTSSLAYENIFGAAIAIPGIFDPISHSVLADASLGFGSSPQENLEQALHVPIRFINRANAATLGEKWYGAGKGVDNLIYVLIGSGIGAGIIINDVLLLGATGGAGEVGHMSILDNGPPCRCGSRGCLESLVSRDLVISRAREYVQRENARAAMSAMDASLDAVDIDYVVNKAQAGNRYFDSLLREQARYIGTAIGNMINMFDPDLVVVGGHYGLTIGEYCLREIQSVAQSRARHFSEVRISLSTLGPLAAPIGAAAYLIS